VSQENVELVRATFEFFLASQGDSGFEAVIAAIETGPISPDVEWDAREVAAFGISDIADVYHGREGVKTFWREWLSAWDAVEFDYELRDAGDSVVALVDQRMRGRATGIEVPLGKYAHLWTFREGLLLRWKFYAEQADALDAAGLSE
jgi:hypothetical protein